jgi:hypothetical protein
MVNNPNLVTNFISKEQHIILVNDQRITSIGRGSLGPLKYVMVAPDLNESLINVSDFDKLNYHTYYGDGKVIIFNKSPFKFTDYNIIAIGHRHSNGLYYFPTGTNFISTNTSIKTITSNQQTSNIQSTTITPAITTCLQNSLSQTSNPTQLHKSNDSSIIGVMESTQSTNLIDGQSTGNKIQHPTFTDHQNYSIIQSSIHPSTISESEPPPSPIISTLSSNSIQTNELIKHQVRECFDENTSYQISNQSLPIDLSQNLIQFINDAIIHHLSIINLNQPIVSQSN